MLCRQLVQLCNSGESPHHARHEEAGRWAPWYKNNPSARKELQQKQPLCVWMCVSLLCMFVCSFKNLCILLDKLTWMSVFMFLFLLQYRFACDRDCICTCVCWCLCLCACLLYTNYSPPKHPQLRRGHFWRDWQKGLLAGYYRLVWSSRSDCCPGRSEMRRNLRSNR